MPQKYRQIVTKWLKNGYVFVTFFVAKKLQKKKTLAILQGLLLYYINITAYLPASARAIYLSISAHSVLSG